jgi:uncharacterized membrane-anchored protein YhcB (DUF1043 family)
MGMRRDWPLLLVVIIIGAAVTALIYSIGRDKGQSDLRTELTQVKDRVHELELKDVRREARWDGPKNSWKCVKGLLPLGKA